MTRLAEHPYSNHAKSFLLKFLHHKDARNVEQHIMPLMHDEAGNPYMEAKGDYSFPSVISFLSNEVIFTREIPVESRTRETAIYLVLRILSSHF